MLRPEMTLLPTDEQQVPTARPQVSVIIPNTDSRQIAMILQQLMNQTVDPACIEILVVGSDQPGQVRQNAQVRFIALPDPACASDKRNRGMHEARGDIFLFLDDDCIPAPDLVERHLARHQHGEMVVGGAVLISRQHYWQLADNLSAFHDLLPCTASGARSYLCTANLSVRRSVVMHAGLMEARKNRAEDLEWTVRFRACGYRLYFEPAARVLHNPPRFTPQALWRHWFTDAPDTIRIRLRYAALLRTPYLARFRWSFFWLAPGIAAWATWNTFDHPHIRACYWHTLPLVYLTKLVWCWGAFASFPYEQKGAFCDQTIPRCHYHH
jgi:glycosyltransferase involved in cell wall biosynthesis